MLLFGDKVLRQTEVDDPEVVVVVGVGKHDVEGLEVEVDDPLAVDELDAPDDLSDEYLALPLSETIVVRSRPGDQVAAGQVLGHQHRVQRGLEQTDLAITRLEDGGEVLSPVAPQRQTGSTGAALSPPLAPG